MIGWEKLSMKRSIKISSVLMALVTVCFICTSCVAVAVAGATAGVVGVAKYNSKGLLPCEFSVGEDRKVRFSGGNLYWDGKKFRMEENQYGTASSIGGKRDAKHVSHFYWSKEAVIACAESYVDSTATAKDKFFASDSYIIKNLTVLTGYDEWEYLLNMRTTTTDNMPANSRYAEVKVNGVNGLLIFPDTFTWTSEMGTAPTVVNVHCDRFGAGTYDEKQFDVMENEGVVFLPAAGLRKGNKVSEVGKSGCYWTSVIDESNAFGLYFSDEYVDSADCNSKNNGYCVRLVEYVD